MNRAAAPMVALLLGLGLFIHGAWTGIHVVRLRLQGVAAHAVLLRYEVRTYRSRGTTHRETWSVLRVHEHECVVSGSVGTIGQTLPVHYAAGNPSDCAPDSGAALRRPIFTLLPGLLLLVGAFYAYQRAAAGGPLPLAP